MQLDPLKTQTSVDTHTAQEALALAIRLQQEHGERVTLEELQKTADEAGIDRVYLESALHKVSNKQELTSTPRFTRRQLTALVIGVAVALVMLVKVAHFPQAVACFIVFALFLVRFVAFGKHDNRR